VEDDRLRVALKDGRELSVPLAWFGWLEGATNEQRRDLEVIEYGLGIWWEALDEGVSVPWLLGLPHH
jgi:hypothetical protein